MRPASGLPQKIAAIALAVLVLFSGFASAQDRSKSKEKILRDQKMIRIRLDRIEEMMERLVRKYEADGNMRNADLIRKARTELKERNIYVRIEQLEEMVRESRLQIIESQEKLSRDLEDIFAILQDRSDLERLEDMLSALADGLAGTQELVNEQNEILRETRDLIYSEEDMVRLALEKVRAIINRQDVLNEKTEEASQEEKAAAHLLELARNLEELAEREDALARKTSDALAERCGKLPGVLSEARKGQEALARRIGKAAVKEEGDVRADTSEFLRRQIEIGESLHAASALLEETGRDDFVRVLKEIEDGIAGIGRELGKGGLARAAEEARKTAAAIGSLEREIGKGGDGGLTSEQEGIVGDLKDVLEKIGSLRHAGPAADAVKKASAAGTNAAASADEAAGSLRGGDDGSALVHEEEAAFLMQEAARFLQRAWENGQGGRKNSIDASAVEQGFLANETGEVEKILEATEIAGQEAEAAGQEAEAAGQEAEAAGLAAEIAGEMFEAVENLRSGAASRAREPQTRAREKLGRLLDVLAERADRIGKEGNEGLSSEEKGKKYKELADRQKELEDKARDLMRRLRDLPYKKPLGHLSDAAQKMGSAARNLGGRHGEQAETDEEDAAGYLKKALKEMKREEQKYQDIRQQEVLFRVKQELETLKSEQDEINRKTKAFDMEREEGVELRRSQRKNLLDMAERETGIRERVIAVKGKIEEDGATVFSWVLDRNRDDLDEVIDSLKRKRTGRMVQAIQKGISRRFDELLSALREELKRRMEASGTSGKKPDRKQPPPLVPPVAELIMIRTMEEGALMRLEELIARDPALRENKADPVRRELIRRMASEHADITELFDKILEQAGDRSKEK